jgi:hypothetical protein
MSFEETLISVWRQALVDGVEKIAQRTAISGSTHA